MEQNGDKLQPTTESYLRSLAVDYPQALASSFPRIANRIAALGGDIPALKAYFDELTQDHRGGRQGFPFQVLMELTALRETMVGDLSGFVIDDHNKWVS